MRNGDGFTVPGARGLRSRTVLVLGLAVFIALVTGRRAGADPVAAPTVTTAPAVSGSAGMGNTLTVGDGVWSNEPTSWSYRWQRCVTPTACVDVGSGSTYVPGFADFAAQLRAVVTTSNAIGSSSATTKLTAAVGGGTRCPSTTILWDGGAASDDWNAPANWRGDRIPGAADVVCIAPDAPGAQVNAPTAPVIRGLRSFKTLLLPVGIYLADPAYANELGNTLWTSGPLNGQVTVRAGATLATLPGLDKRLEIYGSSPTTLTIAPGAKLSVGSTGLFFWCDGSGAAQVVNRGTIEIGNVEGGNFWHNSNGSCTGRDIVNTGTITKVAGLATSRIDAPVANTGTISSTTGTLALNGGTIVGRTSTGAYTGIADGSVSFTNGTAQLDQGATFNGTVVLDGAVLTGKPKINTGATLIARSGWMSAPVTGFGAFSLDGATLAADIGWGGPRTWLSGAITGNVTLGNAATLTAITSGYKRIQIAGPTTTTFTIASGAKFDLRANDLGFRCDGSGDGHLVNNGTINIGDIDNGNFWHNSDYSCTGMDIVNTGLITKSAGLAKTWISAPIANTGTGTISSTSGTLALNGGTILGTTSTGAYTGAGLGTLSFMGGNTQLDTGATLNGNVVLEGAWLTGHPKINTGATLRAASGYMNAPVTGFGTFYLDGATLSADVGWGGPRTWRSGGILGNVSIGRAATLKAVPGGSKYLALGSATTTLTIDAGAKLDLQATDVYFLCNGTGAGHVVNNGTINVGDISGGNFWHNSDFSCTGMDIVNTGLITKTAGATSSYFFAPIANAGTITATKGTLALNGGTIPGVPSTGTYTGTGGATLAFTGGATQLDAGATLNGRVQLAGAVLSGDPVITTGTTLTATGGVMAAPVVGPGNFVMDGATLGRGLGKQLIVGKGTRRTDPSDPTRTIDDSRVIRSGWTSGLVRVDPGATLDLQGTLRMQDGSGSSPTVASAGTGRSRRSATRAR